MMESAIQLGKGDKGLGIDFDRNKEASEIIVKYNRKQGEEKEADLSTQRGNMVPGSKLDSDFLNLFSK